MNSVDREATRSCELGHRETDSLCRFPIACVTIVVLRVIAISRRNDRRRRLLWWLDTWTRILARFYFWSTGISHILLTLFRWNFETKRVSCFSFGELERRQSLNSVHQELTWINCPRRGGLVAIFYQITAKRLHPVRFISGESAEEDLIAS